MRNLLAFLAVGAVLIGLWKWGTNRPLHIETEDGKIVATGDEHGGHVVFNATDPEDAFDIAFDERGLVKDFPADVPIYSPSEVDVSSRMEKGRIVTALLVTQDSVKDVAAFYAEAVPRQGWTVMDEELNGQFAEDTYDLDAMKGPYALRVRVSVRGDGTNIAVGKELLRED